ncbi:MAG: nucleotidyltransferase family protein [Deltaproteobacteria bacterium]
MKLNDALKILSEHRKELRVRYAVRSIALFGSVSRNEASETSDVDVLVEFDKPIGLFAFAHARRYLSELLGCEVDLVTPMALRPEMRERILNDAIHAP